MRCAASGSAEPLPPSAADRNPFENVNTRRNVLELEKTSNFGVVRFFVDSVKCTGIFGLTWIRQWLPDEKKRSEGKFIIENKVICDHRVRVERTNVLLSADHLAPSTFSCLETLSG